MRGSHAQSLCERRVSVREHRLAVRDENELDRQVEERSERLALRMWSHPLCEPGVGKEAEAASGRAVPIREILEGFLALASLRIEVRQASQRLRPIDIPILTGDAGRLRGLTGWLPEISLRQSLEDVLDDWRRRG